MGDIPVFAFAAYSGTGKTTLIEGVLRELKARGLRVAVIKHDGHRFEIDREGKDSWRFAQAGADITVISSQEKTAYIEQRSLSLEQLLDMAHDVDLILVEGYKNASLPQIGIARRATGKGFTAPLERYIAIVTDMDEVETALPRFALEDYQGVAEFMVQNMEDFTHFNEEGRAKMVDVGSKPPTRRTAVAAGRVLVSKKTFDLIRSGGMKKGDVLTVAQVAGVMGAKRTPDLIPMCHPVAVDGIDLSLRLDEARCSVEIEATVSCAGRTGVEMEALTAVSTAALTVYDMCKAVQKDMVISDIRLMKKSGGVHGDFERTEESHE
ncbi:MAG: cyclic pyranopterin monophosphate synthase MoaC [Oscillospiraceae bacterium]|nr:cyclic pyranopterin monophosphate synthase MoaC [Oscillospiraceae bacterium]